MMKQLLLFLTLATLSASAMHSPVRPLSQEEQDIERAIALSMEEQPGEPRQQDDELARVLAISASLAEQERERSVVQPTDEDTDLKLALALSASEVEQPVEQEAPAQQEADNADDELERVLALSAESYKKDQFIRSIETNNVQAVTEALAGGVDVNMRTSSGATLAQIAVRERAHDVLRLLLRSGADCFVVDNQGDTLLHSARDLGTVTILNRLAPALLEMRNNLGRTPLYAALAKGYGYRLIVQRLLKEGAETDIYDNANDHILAHGRFINKEAYKSGIPISVVDLQPRDLIHYAEPSPSICVLKNWGSRMCPYMYPAWPKMLEVQQCRARLREALLCMKRVGNLPLDIRLRIFCADEERQHDLMMIWYFDLCRGIPLPPRYLSMLKVYLADYTVDLIVRLHSLPELAQYHRVLSREADVREIYGEAIRSKLKARLDELQQKALSMKSMET